MKKIGFTLAELMITLGIVGVIVAIAIPAINHLKPDSNKTAYLKAYDTLSQTVKTLASNSQIYPVCKDATSDNNINCSSHPLLNTNQPIVSQLNNAKYSGNVKLCNLLAYSMDAENANCTANTYEYSNETFKNNLSFITRNGMQWKIVPQVLTAANGSAGFQTDVYVDINGNDGNNCMYSASCSQPDIFKFMISASGDVLPADPMGRNYINGRKSLLKKNATITNQNVIASLDSIQNGLGHFTYKSCRAAITEEDNCKNNNGYWYNDTCNTCPIGQTLQNGSCTSSSSSDNPPTGNPKNVKYEVHIYAGDQFDTNSDNIMMGTVMTALQTVTYPDGKVVISRFGSTMQEISNSTDTPKSLDTDLQYKILIPYLKVRVHYGTENWNEQWFNSRELSSTTHRLVFKQPLDSSNQLCPIMIQAGKVEFKSSSALDYSDKNSGVELSCDITSSDNCTAYKTANYNGTTYEWSLELKTFEN